MIRWEQGTQDSLGMARAAVNRAACCYIDGKGLALSRYEGPLFGMGDNVDTAIKELISALSFAVPVAGFGDEDNTYAITQAIEDLFRTGLSPYTDAQRKELVISAIHRLISTLLP